MRKNFYRVLPIIFAWLLIFQGGCGFINNSSDPSDMSGAEIAVPARWSNERLDPAAVQPWLSDFNDPQLTELVKEALDNNRDLRSAAARLAAAEATSRSLSANLLPTVSGEFSTDNNWRDGSANGNGTESANSSTYNLGLRMSWEADIWSKIADQNEAAASEYRASEADYRAFELSLSANVVKAWFRVIEAVHVEQLAAKRLELADHTGQMAGESYDRGLIGSGELHSVREKKANGAIALAAAKVNRDGEVRRLETLLGRYPASLINPGLAKFPQTENKIPAGLPSQLLVRRPDLLAARHRLLASEQRLRASQKEFLPTFKLTAAGGTVSEELHNLLDWDYLVLKLAGNIVQLIFDGGKLRAGEDLARAKQDEKIAAYGVVLLNGFREVETALAADRYFQVRQDGARQALLELEEMERIAEERYRHGIGDIFSLLTARNSTLNGRENQLKITSGRLQTRVNLYLALGGDCQRSE